MRICIKCHQELDESSFRTHLPKKPTHSSWLSSSCKKCERDYARLHKVDTKQRKIWRDQRYIQDPIRYMVVERISSYRAKTVDSNLTTEFLIELWNLQSGKCYYTGLDLMPEGGRGLNSPLPTSATLDRKDPQLGYVQSNVVWCSFRANTAKGNLTEQQFYEYIQLISQNCSKRFCIPKN